MSAFWRCFAFRSTADFEPERLAYAIAAQPAPEMSELAAVNDLCSFVEFCLKQQADDRARPREERVGIGGELWLYALAAEDGEFGVIVRRFLAFPERERDWAIILAKLPENEGTPLSRRILAADA